MATSTTVGVPGGQVEVVFTDRSDGDFAVGRPGPLLDERRRAVVDAPWTWFRQVHGADVKTVVRAGQWAGTEADGAVTAEPGCPLAVMTADCAPVVLVGDRAVAAVHAGWRGIMAGIIEVAADRLRDLGASPVTTIVGPCINPAAYEFSPDDLALIVERLGPAVEGETSWGTPALDVPGAVAAACELAQWPTPVEQPPCTSDQRWHSHRTRAEPGRQAAVVWIAPPDQRSRTT